MVYAPRRLIVSFLLVLLLPAVTVVWLGIRLMEQDRALEVRLLRERRESTCDRLVAALEQRISHTERSLAENPRLMPEDDAVVVAIEADGIEVSPHGRLLYYPVSPTCRPEPSAPFAAAEDLEFRSHDYLKAAANLRGLATATDAGVRAGALLRLARNLRKANRADEAVRVYDSLAQLRDACVSGLPASLIARRARAALLAEQARLAELRAEARSLQADLLHGLWRIDRGTYQNYASQLQQWLASGWADQPDREALADAVEWFWRNRTSAPAGRRDLLLSGIHFAVLWQTSERRVMALVAGPRFQQREWFAALADNRDFHFRLAGDGGQPVFAAPLLPGSTLQRTASETGLPWTVSVANDERAEREAFSNRRRLLLAGLSILGALVLIGSYFILRAVTREFAVAQLQSDFVSAVSHEFRTPLTTLRQYTELLSDNEELPLEKRRLYYQAQERATGRLNRMVESLLDFGRMQAGKRPYRLEQQPAAIAIHGIVDEFEREVAPKNFVLNREIDESSGSVDIDRDALGHAVWNLLDNAVKYSGDSRTIWVSVEGRNGSVAIGVRDRGIGIPQQEQRDIFSKFVRGSCSRAQGIEGTGIGLAIVKHIVEAHGGSVQVNSVPGEGSTFTILLPRKD
jgi:signal transduction histidine kinase